MKHKLLISMALMMLVAACTSDQDTDPQALVTGVASEFLAAWYDQYPGDASESGYPHAPMDRFADLSPDTLAEFDSKVDAWLAALENIDPTLLAGTPAAHTWMFTGQRLQTLVDMRVCRMSLWNVSPTWTGWQSRVIATLGVQPVATSGERKAALSRAADIARLIDTEISNLRHGLDQGFLAPAGNVAAVLRQTESLLATPIEESPLFDPASRSDTAAFIADYRDTLESSVKPALTRYRDFIRDEYEGRKQTGVAANPQGKACYTASTRFYASLAMTPEDIHRAGLSEIARIQAEMLSIAKEHFGTDDLATLFDELRSNPVYAFPSEQAVLDYVNAAVVRAEAAMNELFHEVPASTLVVYAAPAYEQDSGGGFYSSGASQDELLGYYKVGTYNPTGISKATVEATAFHESWPGHHLDSIVTLSNRDLHDIQRYMWVSGVSEGWALYSERLADEVGLYSSEVSRIGMLSNEAFRAARLVVDTGIHVLGWTREQAIQYMLDNTAEGESSIVAEVDRYAAVPGQATSYLLGSLEIQRLRRRAETALGNRFDIRDFHHRILGNGAVTLPMLGAAVDLWIDETLSE